MPAHRSLSTFPLALAFVLALALTWSAAASSAPLLGTETVLANVDGNPSGQAEAFRTTAAASGSLTGLKVYVDASSAPGLLTAGLYTDSNGRPASLLASGSIASRAAGAWNTVTFAEAATVTAGQAYWITVLGPAGSAALRFRDGRSQPAEISRSRNLVSLPPTWTSARSSRDGGLSAYAVAVGDSTSPSMPGNLTTSGVTRSQVTLSWTASTDDVGVQGYDLFLDGAKVGTTPSTTFTYGGLGCRTEHTVSVDAYDAAGNVSSAAAATVTTSSCADTQAPTAPGALTTSVRASSAALSWAASFDDQGVTGYRLFQDGSQVGTSLSTSYIFGGLTCATTYTLGVAAVDGAGNMSGLASVSVTTAACSGGSSASVFVAQSTAGSGDGSSCANARAATYFNTASNWGAGKAIAPGVTVGLCGTISSTLNVQGSGLSGSPITLQFQSAAKLEQPVCDPCLNLDNRSFIVVDGNNTGQVDSKANGTLLANHSRSTAISADPCTSCEIKNLTIGPVYQIAAGDSFICAGGCAIDNAGVKCVRYSGANWKIDGNTLHDASWCLYEYGNGSDANTQIYGNNIYNIDHGWTITGGGPYGHLYFHHNHMHDMAVWDACDSGSNCHHDGIHCFFGPGSGASFAGSYIYDNVFDGTLGGNATAWIYLESNPSSPCANSSSKWYIFNNVFSSTDQVSTNPYVTVAVGTVPNTAYLYNNTFSGPGGGHYGSNGAACSDTSVDFENNAVGGCAQFNGAGSGVTDYNAYAFQSTATNCWPAAGGTCTFSSWQAAGHDTHGAFSKLGAVGSNAPGVGTNLTSLCTGDLTPLCSDINGTPRPTTGPWTAGA